MTGLRLNKLINFIILICITFSYSYTYSQVDSVLVKMRARDSIASIKAKKAYQSNTVTSELHSILFRNIYASHSNNEEELFNSERERLKDFEGKIIDSIVIVQLNTFGESVYDSSVKSNKFEKFLSKKIHKNTRLKVLKNRYLLFKKNENFSFYKARENSRLVRSSGILHDMRIEPYFYKNDSNHIIVKYIIQDVFPYGGDLSVDDYDDYTVGINNINFLGLAHKVGVTMDINARDTIQKFGYGVSYEVPNFFRKKFIDLKFQYLNTSLTDLVSAEMSRSFSRPEFRWAGGVSSYYFYDQRIETIARTLINNSRTENSAWLSYSFPFKNYNKTINSFIVGMSFKSTYNFVRPRVGVERNFRFWNTNLALMSIGYSKYSFTQERLLNGFGRTEDIPVGFSVNALVGHDITEFGGREYLGFQFITQQYTKSDFYVNTGFKVGSYYMPNRSSPFVIDFETQSASPVIRLGKFRMRNFLKTRLTAGVNYDSTYFLKFNDYDGVRSEIAYTNRGDSRLTAGFQSNLYMPFSFLGFRYYIFALGEIGKIQYGIGEMFKSPILGSVNMGIGFKNENLIFDLIQVQYSLASSTNLNVNRGILVTSVLPFRIINLDISKPKVVRFD